MHVPPDGLLRAHSVAEAFLYVSLTWCPHCMRRPVRAEGEIRRGQTDWTLTISCAGCGQRSELQFDINPPPTRSEGGKRINPSNNRSEVIDLVGWVSLCRAIVDGADKEPDRTAKREMLLEAAECLDEALRFFEAEADAPPTSAFFSPRSAARYDEHPQLFLRSHLVDLGAKLPVRRSAAADEGRPASRKNRAWWRFW